jgi:hypothetical protein
LEGGPSGFPQGFTCPVVLGNKPGDPYLSLTGLLPTLAGRSRPLLLGMNFVTPWELRSTPWLAPQHRYGNAYGLDTASVWADPRSLAATKGIEVSFSSSGY